MVIGHFQVVKPGTYSVESDKGDDASIAQASSCPLANFSSTFTEIRLVVPLDNALWRVNGQKERRTEVLKGQLTHLCTGHSSANPESKWAKILRGDKMALEAESEAQKEQFGTMRCRIFTHAGREDRSVVVEVFPSNLSSNRSVDAKEFDWENKKVGETYRLKAPGTFPTDEVTMRAHKKFGEPVTFEWSMAIVKNKMGYEAPIVGIIENSFDDITSFVGVEEDNVALEPIFNNVLGERAQDAVGSVKNAVDDFKAELKQFVSNPKYRPQVPAVQLFGLEKCDDAANTLATHNQLPRELTDSVNQSQSSAIENILNHKISVTWGAPGTGKSRVLSETILFLLDNTEERIVATAGANVAVDPLLRKVLEGYRSRHPSDRIPIIRVYSQAQIFTQYATGEFELLDSECHLEALRVRRASNDPEFAGFLNAVRQLRQYGKIRDEAIYKAYISQGSQLTRTILENEIRLVFCTITGCQSPALYKVSPKDHEIEWAYPATSLFLDEAGTMTRPMMEMPVMAFVKTTTRVGMAGDPFQLPATIISDLGKKEWAGSWLKKIVDQKWPVVFLNVQYRMPDMLYDHLNAVTYVNELKRQGLDKIDSFKHVGNPTDFGARLQAALPIIFQVGIQSVAIDSIENFIDVADGIQESLEGGSSWNTPEINAINNAVLELVSRDFKQEEIAVITGYSEQKRRLTEKAKGNGWAGVQQILTIDSSQGDEFKIVFISLVTTRNLPGFMGTPFRACVGTSRQMEALYFVGQAKYWFSSPGEGGFKAMHNMLRHIRSNRTAFNQPPFILGAPTQDRRSLGVREAEGLHTGGG